MTDAAGGVPVPVEYLYRAGLLLLPGTPAPGHTAARNSVLGALRCFKWVTQREVMYAGVGSVRLGSWSLAAVR
jgi:hypothetical protein